MAIEIRIPKEIREYKSKGFFGFTLRQFSAIALTLAINVPLYIFGSRYIGKEAASWLVMFIAAPTVLIGFFEIAGLPFEKFIFAVIKTLFLNPQKRIYVTEGTCDFMSRLKGEILDTNAKKKKEKYNKRVSRSVKGKKK